MKYCPNCGKELFDEAVLCPGCGQQQQAVSTEDDATNLAPPTPDYDIQQPQHQVAPPMPPQKPKVSVGHKLKAGVKKNKSVLKKILIIIVSVIVAALLAICIYQVVCGVYINNNLDKWVATVKTENATPEEISTVKEEVHKYSPYYFELPIFPAITKAVCNDINTYDLLDYNIELIYDIKYCYEDYLNNSVDSESTELFNTVVFGLRNSLKTWSSNEILSQYYNRYLIMLPTLDKVEATGHINFDDQTISVIIENKNAFPIYQCAINCNFTIMYVKASSYSNLEWGRGTKTISIPKVLGNSSETVTQAFNPSDYYESYSSYMYCSLYDSSFNWKSISCNEVFEVELPKNSTALPSSEKEKTTAPAATTTTPATTASSGNVCTVTTQGGKLNMRSGAGEEFDIVTQVPNGTTVTVEDSSGNWAYINYGGSYGWVSMDYLQKAS